jgi:hypothetical protein
MNWGVVSNAQNPNWVVIGSNQNANWQIGNTS